MYLYFNKNGTLITQINHGDIPRQGANLDVFALVDTSFFDEKLDPDLEHWTANIKVIDTRGESVVTTVLMTGLNSQGHPEPIVFSKANNAEVTFDLVNGQTYYAFEYLIISSPTGFPAVTALSGNIKIGIDFINSEDSNLDVTCGEATVYIEPVLNASYLRNTINPSQYRQLIYRIEHLTAPDSGGNNYSIAYNLVVNANGYQFPGYKFASVSIPIYSDYTVKQFQNNLTSEAVSDTEIIKSYLEAITGHNRIPVYDAAKPIGEYVICSYDNTVWKLQYDSTNGLLAFKVENIPLIPTKTSDLTNDSGYITSSALNGYVTENTLENTLEGYVDNQTLDNTLENYAQESDIPTKTSDLTNDSGYQTASQVTTAINNALTNVYKFKGSIDISTLNSLISSAADKSVLNGYVYNITDSGNLNNSTGTLSVVAGDNVAFVYNNANNWEWDKLAGTIDTSNFATLSDIPTNNNQLTNGAGYQTQTQVENKISEGVPYLTTAPSSANTSGKLKFVVLDSEPSTYYDGYYYIITQAPSTSHQVTITADGAWANEQLGYVKIYDGQDTTGTPLLDQTPANKSAYPITLEITSGYCSIDINGPALAPGTDVSSDDYANSPSGLGYWQFTIDKDGSLNIYIGDFDD